IVLERQGDVAAELRIRARTITAPHRIGSAFHAPARRAQKRTFAEHVAVSVTRQRETEQRACHASEPALALDSRRLPRIKRVLPHVLETEPETESMTEEETVAIADVGFIAPGAVVVPRGAEILERAADIVELELHVPGEHAVGVARCGRVAEGRGKEVRARG